MICLSSILVTPILIVPTTAGSKDLPPVVVPGTRTEEKKLLQSRRWLLAERETRPLRFSLDALTAVELLFHKE